MFKLQTLSGAALWLFHETVAFGGEIRRLRVAAAEDVVDTGVPRFDEIPVAMHKVRLRAFLELIEAGLVRHVGGVRYEVCR